MLFFPSNRYGLRRANKNRYNFIGEVRDAKIDTA